jgi:hypothetical protein
MPKRYEHTIRYVDTHVPLLSAIEAMEEGGWELCTTDRLPQAKIVLLFFKRPVPLAPDPAAPAAPAAPRPGVEL